MDAVQARPYARQVPDNPGQPSSIAEVGLMNDEPGETSLRAVREVARGQFVTGPELTRQFMNESAPPAEPPPSEALACTLGTERPGVATLRPPEAGRAQQRDRVPPGLGENIVATYQVRLSTPIGVKSTPEA
jgi:hypothetical protein